MLFSVKRIIVQDPGEADESAVAARLDQRAGSRRAALPDATCRETLRSGSDRERPFRRSRSVRRPLRHGGELLALGFNLSQVVHDYGDICQAVTEVAVENTRRSRSTNFTR